MVDGPKSCIPRAQSKTFSFAFVKIVLELRKFFQCLSDQRGYLFVLHTLKQGIHRLESSFQIVIVLPGIHPGLFHIPQPSWGHLHNSHEDALTARRQIFDHIGHIKKCQSAVARRISGFEMADRLAAGPDRTPPSYHCKENSAFFVL